MIFGDDVDNPLPSARPFSPQAATRGNGPSPQQTESSVHQSIESQTTTTSEAPQRPARQPKQLPVDERAELTNRQLNEWNQNYLKNMLGLARVKAQHKSLAQAKKNASFWVLDQGIGAVEANFADERVAHPLSIFSGQALLEALMETEGSTLRSKRSRSPTQEQEEDQERRVRTKTDEHERGRGEQEEVHVIGDDDGIMPQPEENIESEVGRRAPSSITDRPSSMPWSRHTGSRQGSVLPGVSFSVGGAAAGIQLGPPSVLSGRGLRLTSASPLVGRGHPRLPSLDLEGVGSHQFNLGEAMDVDDFELYVPRSRVDTQTAAQSRWLRTTLENESHNFLAFLETQIAERGNEEEVEEGNETRKSITMDALLSPKENNAVVGAQALLHILSLTTKGLMEVEQQEGFGDITMRVVYIDGQAAEA